MNQNFSSDQLLKLCKQSEIIDSGKTKEELSKDIDETFVKIANGTFDFSIVETPGFFKTESLIDTLVIRKLNDNLKRLYKDVQSNRRVIVNQVSILLQETCPFWILRTDIASFYESINRARLLEKLQSDSLLSYFSIWLLKKLFSNSLITDKTGLPRGLSLSSTLSELYMRKFDRWVKTFDGVYYYARFVDDIIIFFNKKNSLDNLNLQMEANLEKGLYKNNAKTKKYDGGRISDKNPLDYLGYKFTVGKIKNEKSLVVSISDKKIKKIKSRVVYSFVSFINNKDFSLLEKRIKFLTGNYSIKSRIDGNDLRAGIYYNYININHPQTPVLNQLNTFFQKTLNSKRYSFGLRLSALISANQRAVLSRYSFKHGFENKIYHSFSPAELKEISSCWK